MSSASNSSDKGSAPRTIRRQKSFRASTISTVYEVFPAASQSAASTNKSSVTEEDVDGISTEAQALIAAAERSDAANIKRLKEEYGDDTKASTS